MTGLINYDPIGADGFGWLALEPQSIDSQTGCVDVRFIIGYWCYWDESIEDLERIQVYKCLCDEKIADIFGRLHTHSQQIVRAGFVSDPLNCRTIGQKMDDEPDAATVGYRWSIIGSWDEMQPRISEFADEHLDSPLVIEAQLSWDKLYFKVKEMDKLINKVKADVNKNDKPKAKKDIKTLLKADKKQDAKVERCDKIKKRKT